MGTYAPLLISIKVPQWTKFRIIICSNFNSWSHRAWKVYCSDLKIVASVSFTSVGPIFSMYFHRKYDTVSFVTSQKQKDRVAELRLRDLSTWWHGFDMRSVCMRIVLDNITVEQGVLQILSVSFHQ